MVKQALSVSGGEGLPAGCDNIFRHLVADRVEQLLMVCSILRQGRVDRDIAFIGPKSVVYCGIL
tara:strand:- start:9322 stop:9513 length:192 start_codon:yes stop_codon:yes gene_type:complete